MRMLKEATLGLLCFSMCAAPLAQDVDPVGYIWGNVEVNPEIEAIVAHDNRVQYDAQGDAQSDEYGEVAARIALNNLPAKYNLQAQAGFGHRYYSEFTKLNDDFYNAGLAASSTEGPFVWGVSGDIDKSLNYDVDYDPDTENRPDSILSDQPNRRTSAQGNVGYALEVSEKTSLVPAYNLSYYHQEFENGGSAEWRDHTASAELRYAVTDRTTLRAGGYYSLQVNDDEEGYIVAVGGGAESQLTEKTSWALLAGIGHADYETSGSDNSGLLDARLSWQVTDLLSAYLFYGNTYEPGYSGGAARMLYRGGYGASWQFAPRWTLGGSVLHDYSQEVGDEDSSAYGGVRHFFSLQCAYAMTQRLNLALQASHTKDDEPASRTLLSLRMGYAF